MKNNIFWSEIYRVRIWRTGRHTPTKNSQKCPVGYLGFHKMLPRDYLVSEPIAINIQNRQHIRSFYPFNSVRAAFSKSLRQVICALCFRTEPDSCHPNSHFSFQSLRFFLRFLSRPFFIILTHLIRSEPPPPAPPSPFLRT